MFLYCGKGKAIDHDGSCLISHRIFILFIIFEFLIHPLDLSLSDSVQLASSFITCYLFKSYYLNFSSFHVASLARQLTIH